MSALNIPLIAFGTALTVLVFAFGVRRLMGLPLSPLRTLIAGLIAFFAAAEGRTRLARSLRLALEDGGVTFVKLGQILSTRRDLLPAEFIGELSHLQDDAPQVPWPRIEEVLRSELDAGVEEVFGSFDRDPIAAASIAQVHAATLTTGDRVVVKVRRPDVTATSPPGSRPTSACSPTCSVSSPTTGWPCRRRSRRCSGPWPPWRGP